MPQEVIRVALGKHFTRFLQRYEDVSEIGEKCSFRELSDVSMQERWKREGHKTRTTENTHILQARGCYFPSYTNGKGNGKK